MELIFNELSAFSAGVTETEVYETLARFKDCYYAAVPHGFKGIRFDNGISDLGTIDATGANVTDNPKLRDVISWIYTVASYPRFRRSADVELRYAANDFSVICSDGKSHTAYGIGAAYLLCTSAISLSHEPHWRAHIHSLTVSGSEAGTYNVLAISLPTHCATREFLSLAEAATPLELVKDLTEPENKSSHYHPDHGADIVDAKWRLLRQSPYVMKALITLPFDSKARDFIEKVQSGGIIHIRFTDTKQGLGLKIKTTGRTLRETQAIAEILQQKYAR